VFLVGDGPAGIVAVPQLAKARLADVVILVDQAVREGIVPVGVRRCGEVIGVRMAIDVLVADEELPVVVGFAGSGPHTVRVAANGDVVAGAGVGSSLFLAKRSER